MAKEILEIMVADGAVKTEKLYLVPEIEKSVDDTTGEPRLKRYRDDDRLSGCSCEG